MNLSFTHDEAYTFNSYIQSSWKNVLFLEGSISANNHIPLTIILKLLFANISIAELSLRMPTIISLLCLIVFFISERKKLNYQFALLFVAFVLSSQLIVDLFSLARGYGLSIVFMVLHFYYLGSFGNSTIDSRSSGLKATFYLFMAVFFNFSFLIYAAGNFIVLFFNHFLLNGISVHSFLGFVKQNIIWLLFGLLVFPILKLVECNQLYFGGHIGIYEDSILKLFLGAWRLPASGFSQLFDALVVLTLLICLFMFFHNVYTIVRKKKSMIENYWGIVFFLCLLVEYLQHLILNTPYLLDRTAIIFWLLMAGNLASFFSLLSRFGSSKIFVSLSIVMSAALFYSGISIVKNQSPVWYMDASNREILPFIFADADKAKEITIDNEWFYEPGLNYYRHRQNFQASIKEFNRDEFREFSSLYYVVSGAKKSIFENDKFLLMRYFEVSDTYVFKLKPLTNEK